MKHIALSTLIPLALAACQPSTTAQRVNIKFAQTVSAPAQLISNGGRKLSQSDIKSELVDRLLKGEDFEWIISPDGTSVSIFNETGRAVPGEWQFRENQYCRRSKDARQFRCSDVYALGPVYRFSEPKSPGTLAPWYVTAE